MHHPTKGNKKIKKEDKLGDKLDDKMGNNLGEKLEDKLGDKASGRQTHHPEGGRTIQQRETRRKTSWETRP